MKDEEWFKTKLVSRKTWAIDDHGGDVMYLATGEERCLLIDTGWGIGDLPKTVSSLSALPLIVVNTHGHPDHSYGNSVFEEVCIHEADKHFIDKLNDARARKWMIKNVLPKPLPKSFTPDMWASKVPSIKTIKDGYVFDLGNRHLQTISVPGHSPGSICLLDRENRLLFTGDTIQNPSWLHLQESQPLSQFLENLKRLQSFSGEFDCYLPAHTALEPLPLPKQHISELIAGIEGILSGKRVGREEKTFAGDGLRCDFGSTAVVYRPDNL